MNFPITCFVIDDDPDDHDLFSFALEKAAMPVNCHFEADPLKALNLLRSDGSFTPDYIFIDLHMPAIDGFECLEVIRRISRLQETRVYIYSGFYNEAVVMQAKALGATDFIKKEANLDALANAIKQVLSQGQH